MRARLYSLTLSILAASAAPIVAGEIELGARPAWLVGQMDEGNLKDMLSACIGRPAARTTFSIGHRGAPLQFPEHTEEGYRAAALMGAGVLECDVTFTYDKELVCRHSQNDLHTTTNILTSPLAEKCTAAFQPASGDDPASADCRTSDVTLDEFKSLTGKMASADKTATTFRTI